MICRAASLAGFDVEQIDVPSLLGRYRGLWTAKSGSVNLLCVNADQTPRVSCSIPSQVLSESVNVGYWNWELEEFPARFLPAFAHVDEVWTPSTFVQESILLKSPVPFRVPIPVEVTNPIPLPRQEIGAQEGEFLFLFAFDMASVFERKNPLAVVRAFGAVCNRRHPCRLILKVSQANEQQPEMQRLREACSGLPVTILKRELSEERMRGLVQTADCIVSLHRSEGFGLLLAEGMALGKPVIATGYSGNLDFMNSRVSYLTDYDLVPVPSGCPPYDTRARWAEPNWHQAAEYMRSMLSDPGTARMIGERGRDHVRSLLSPVEIGLRMRQRIEILVSGPQRIPRLGTC
jgi:glycosyltransferase involved in cell wall biosynthesis